MIRKPVDCTSSTQPSMMWISHYNDWISVQVISPFVRNLKDEVQQKTAHNVCGIGKIHQTWVWSNSNSDVAELSANFAHWITTSDCSRLLSFREYCHAISKSNSMIERFRKESATYRYTFGTDTRKNHTKNNPDHTH